MKSDFKKKQICKSSLFYLGVKFVKSFSFFSASVWIFYTALRNEQIF
jgi:hypothetical protein